MRAHRPLFRGSRLANAYMRFFGARVHYDAFVNNRFFTDPPLLELNARCVVDDGNKNAAHVFEDGTLRFAPKRVGPNAILHPHGVTWAGDIVPPGVVLGPCAQLHGGAPPGSAAGAHLQGCPARLIRIIFHEPTILQEEVSFHAQTSHSERIFPLQHPICNAA